MVTCLGQESQGEGSNCQSALLMASFEDCAVVVGHRAEGSTGLWRRLW